MLTSVLPDPRNMGPNPGSFPPHWENTMVGRHKEWLRLVLCVKCFSCGPAATRFDAPARATQCHW